MLRIIKFQKFQLFLYLRFFILFIVKKQKSCLEFAYKDSLLATEGES